MTPEDELALRITRYVAATVPPQQVEAVARTVCMTVATLMADEGFTNELVVVKRLREENQWLRTQYTILKQMMDKVGVSVRPSKPRSTASKRPAAKKSAAKRASPSARRSASPSMGAFTDGFREMRRK